jgi:hypothetical protein
VRCEFWKRKIKIKIKRIGPSHTFEKAGYPLCLIKKKRKREKEKGRRAFRRDIALFDDDAKAKAKKQRRPARRRKKKKKKRDLNYFPKGFKSENLSETSLFSISRGKVTLRDIKPHEGVHFGRLDARESLREIRNIARR